MMSKTCAIVPAAGRGLRMGAATPKQFLELFGKPILQYTLETLASVRFLSEIVVVVQKDFLSAAEDIIRSYCHTDPGNWHFLSKKALANDRQSTLDEAHVRSKTPEHEREGGSRSITLAVGGAERQDSVFNALRELPADCDWVLIHDGVRPFVSAELLQNTWKAAQDSGSAIAALPATDTVKRVREQSVIETLSRQEIWFVQTPQVFRRDIILAAYREARRQGVSGTDDAYFVERLGLPVSVVQGERSNVKVTTPDDLAWGNWFLRQGTGRDWL